MAKSLKLLNGVSNTKLCKAEEAYEDASSSSFSNKPRKIDHCETDVRCSWNILQNIAENVGCQQRIVANVVQLLDNDCTIPFIARYRKEQTNFMEPDKLREIKEQLDELREVQTKAVSVIKKVEKLGKLDESLKSALLASETIEDIEHLYAPFKPGGKRTLAERARQLGLEPFAKNLLSSTSITCLQKAVNPNVEGLSNTSDVQQGVKHIIADMMAKDIRIIDPVRRMCRQSVITLQSKRIATSKKTEKCADAKKKQGFGKASGSKPGKDVDAEKYRLYFDFRISISNIKPHQVLAVNRGESVKVLRVSFIIPPSIRVGFERRCFELYMSCGDGQKRQLINDCARDAYDRLVEPMLIRRFRSDLTKMADKASVSVFASNLKKLLLTPPVRGKPVLGVDLGFSNGCKFAMISATGNVEETGVAYLHQRGCCPKKELNTIKGVVLKYRCETIAIGNGVGCRETEKILSDAIQNGAFRPLTVMFCIVSEAGASVYSASEDAQKELPDLNVSVRGAVSIARRLQDPLAELVKIDPKSLGVGMYQHDVSEARLKTALNGVVEDAVGVIGADVNVASEALLRHISGISEKLAKKIIEFRYSQGPFINRSQLMNIPGIGVKTFEQCAGFLRIMSSSLEIVIPDGAEDCEEGKGRKRKCAAGGKTTKAKKPKLDLTRNMLDATWVHPESYELADRLLKMARLDKSELGQWAFIAQLKSFISSVDIHTVAESLSTTEVALKQIIDGLLQPLDADVRDHFEKPLFRSCVTSISDISSGTLLTGAVVNVTHFGAFVDVGVGFNGLIHSNAISPALLPPGRMELELGDHVEVCVEFVDVERHRIGLSLFRLLN